MLLNKPNINPDNISIDTHKLGEMVFCDILIQYGISIYMWSWLPTGHKKESNFFSLHVLWPMTLTVWVNKAA